ncbi:hypothetical protein BJ912DRAFT_1013236 [Pholiota molesta]|nr:hypothetical protein BJ912DRAFT_1013236 [Pholiota molesta]
MSAMPTLSPADSAMEVYDELLPSTAQPEPSTEGNSHPSPQPPAPTIATPIPKGSSENKPTGRKRHHDEDDAPAPDPKRATSNSRAVVVNNRDATPPAEQTEQPEQPDREDGNTPWWQVDPLDSLTEEQPRDGDDPFDAQGRVVVPTEEDRFAIHGITHKELFALAGKQTRASWNEEPEPKVIVYIPGDKYRRDPSTTTDIIQAVVTRIIEYEKFMVIPCTPDNQKTADPNALYVPVVVGTGNPRVSEVRPQPLPAQPATRAYGYGFWRVWVTGPAGFGGLETRTGQWQG